MEMQYWSIKVEVLKNVVNHLQKSGLFVLHTTVTKMVTVKERNVSSFYQSTLRNSVGSKIIKGVKSACLKFAFRFSLHQLSQSSSYLNFNF